MIMPKTEFKVGEVFQLGLINIKVEEAVQVRCEECFVSTMKGTCGDYRDLVGSCLERNRQDKRNVVFVKLK